LVQETDHAAPVRGARLVLAGDASARASMTASWLAQMGWEVIVVDDLVAWSRHNGLTRTGPHQPRQAVPPDEADEAPPDAYRRPYVGTAAAPEAMQAYLDWEHGLVAQLERDGTHRFSVWQGGAPAGVSPCAR
jgi:hypothetical protein